MVYSTFIEQQADFAYYETEKGSAQIDIGLLSKIFGQIWIARTEIQSQDANDDAIIARINVENSRYYVLRGSSRDIARASRKISGNTGEPIGLVELVCRKERSIHVLDEFLSWAEKQAKDSGKPVILQYDERVASWN